MRASLQALVVVVVVGLGGCRTGTLAFCPGGPSPNHRHRTTFIRTSGTSPLLPRQPQTSSFSNNNNQSALRAAARDNHGDDTKASPLDEYLDQVQLKQAIQYLQQHPDLELTPTRWKRIFDAIEERTRQASRAEDFAVQQQQQESSSSSSSASFPLESPARQEMTNMYETLHQLQHLTLYGACSTTTPPAAGSHSVAPAVLEQILDLPMQALTPQQQTTQTLLLAGGAAAVVEVMVSAVSGIDVNTLFLATLAASLVDRLVCNGAVLESILKTVNPTLSSKILRHEAGHFLVAYLLGCPVEGIVLTAWEALQDERFARRQVSAGTSFYDPELSRQMNRRLLSNNNSRAPVLTRSSIDRYSMIVMAGIAAEADQYGRADGGAGDEMALVAFLSRLQGNRNRQETGDADSVAVWDAAAIKNQARWGALQAMLLIREYQPAYDALVAVLEEEPTKGNKRRAATTLGDCIYAIEQAAREHNLQPLQRPIGYLIEDDNEPDSVIWRTRRRTRLGNATSVTLEPKDGEKSSKINTRMNREESLAVLKEYRTVVEKRVEELDRQLKKLN